MKAIISKTMIQKVSNEKHPNEAGDPSKNSKETIGGNEIACDEGNGKNGTVPSSIKSPPPTAAAAAAAAPKSSSCGKIEDRLSKAVEVSTSTTSITKHRSPELVPLTADYEQMKKQLRNLIGAIKKYQKQTQLMQESKFELVQELATLSKKSPIYDEVGCDLKDDQTTEALRKLRHQQPQPSSPLPHNRNEEIITHSGVPSTKDVAQIAEDYHKRMENRSDGSTADGDTNNNKLISLYGLYSFGAAQAVANDYEYQIHIVEYATEWERIVTERVDDGLKNVRKLEADRRHYERKVDALRKKYNAVQSKGKPCPESQIQKLQRNEDKLREAFTVHEREAGKLCALIEAVTHSGYMDLYPLVKNYMKWEVNRIGREHYIATQMTTALDSMTEKCGSKKKRSISKNASK
jgi:hypothetical protein